VNCPPLLSRHRLARHPVSPPRAPPPPGTDAGGLWTVDGQSAHDWPSFEVDLEESGRAELRLTPKRGIAKCEKKHGLN
jgi:hypothetical protein